MQRVISHHNNYEHLLVFWCMSLMQGDRCSPSMGGLTVYSRHRHITHNTLADILGPDSTCGFSLEDYEMIPQTGILQHTVYFKCKCISVQFTVLLRIHVFVV